MLDPQRCPTCAYLYPVPNAPERQYPNDAKPIKVRVCSHRRAGEYWTADGCGVWEPKGEVSDV